MKKNDFLIFLLMVTTMSSCQSNSKKETMQKDTIKEKPECKVLYDKYLEKFSNEENDSALFYIDKYIKCDPTKKENKYYKVQLLISMKDFKNAILVFDDLTSKDDPALKMQKGVLMLKVSDSNSKKVLEETYKEFNQIKSPTSSNQFYKIGLDNYFKGKDFALIEVEKFKEQHKGKPYENQNINAIENLIRNESKEDVLFKLFNIRD